MKCIRLNTREIVRVKDAEAALLVDTKQGKYCPKYKYKEYRRINRRN